MKNKRNVGVIAYLVIMALLMSWALGVFDGGGNDIPYSRVVELFRTEQVRSFTVENGYITMSLHSPYNGETVVSTALADPESFRQELTPLFLELSDKGILEGYDFVPEVGFTPYDLVFPLIIVGMVLLFAWAMFMSRMNSQNPMSNFGRARTVLGVPDGKKVTFTSP